MERKKALLPRELAERLLPPLEGGSLAAKLRRLLETLDAIDEFSGQTQRPVTIMLEGVDGIQREYKLIYMGLSNAFAVSDALGIAGIGTRAEGNWSWQWDKSYFPVLSKALLICEGKCAPELLPLPLPFAEARQGGDK